MAVWLVTFILPLAFLFRPDLRPLMTRLEKCRHRRQRLRFDGLLPIIVHATSSCYIRYVKLVPCVL
jgi:hypothetical protein